MKKKKAWKKLAIGGTMAFGGISLMATGNPITTVGGAALAMSGISYLTPKKKRKKR